MPGEHLLLSRRGVQSEPKRRVPHLAWNLPLRPDTGGRGLVAYGVRDGSWRRCTRLDLMNRDFMGALRERVLVKPAFCSIVPMAPSKTRTRSRSAPMKSRFMRSSLVHLRQLPSRTPYATRPRPPCRVEGVGSRRDAAHDVSVRSGPHACSGADARLACRRVALRLQRVPTVRHPTRSTR